MNSVKQPFKAYFSTKQKFHSFCKCLSEMGGIFLFYTWLQKVKTAHLLANNANFATIKLKHNFQNIEHENYSFNFRISF